MAIRTIPDAQSARDARFNQLKVERFRAEPALALGHANSRNQRVVEVLCYLSLLRSAAKLSPRAVVTCSPARRQFFKSPDGYQAAHYLPCQILVNGAAPWTFIETQECRMRFECLFADVEHLPANFNKADSAAEAKGLIAAFQASCQALLNDAQPSPAGKINRALVRQTYLHVWCPRARAALEAALAQKDSRPHLPPLQRNADGDLLNLDERSGADDGQWRIEDQMRILEHYLQSLQTQPRALQDYRMLELERQFAS
jgi:hypothetical protein